MNILLFKEINYLTLKGSIVGARVKAFNGEYFDMDTRVLKNAIGGETLAIQQLPLTLVGDLYMTEDEVENNYVVDELPNNKEVLKWVKALTLRNQKDITKVQNAWVEKKDRILNGVWNQLVSRQERDNFTVYDMIHFSGGGNPYKGLSTKQLETIQEYFKRMSRLMFLDNQAKAKLHVTPNRAAKMANLLMSASDWEYAGSWDTGDFGGGCCTLGHLLRYEHYAYSPSLGETIVFGEKCVSDFFEVSHSEMRRIVNIQTELVREVKVIKFLFDKTPKERQQNKYSEVERVVSELKDKVEKMSKEAICLEFMTKFKKVGLPLTNSMLKVIYMSDRISSRANTREVSFNEIINTVYTRGKGYLTKDLIEKVLKGEISNPLGKHISVLMRKWEKDYNRIAEYMWYLQRLLVVLQETDYVRIHIQNYLEDAKETYSTVDLGRDGVYLVDKLMTFNTEDIPSSKYGVSKRLNTFSDMETYNIIEILSREYKRSNLPLMPSYKVETEDTIKYFQWFNANKNAFSLLFKLHQKQKVQEKVSSVSLVKETLSASGVIQVVDTPTGFVCVHPTSDIQDKFNFRRVRPEDVQDERDFLHPRDIAHFMFDRLEVENLDANDFAFQVATTVVNSDFVSPKQEDILVRWLDKYLNYSRKKQQGKGK